MQVQLLEIVQQDKHICEHIDMELVLELFQTNYSKDGKACRLAIAHGQDLIP